MKDNLKDIGILGRRHYDYLKANKPTVINVMRMNGTLNSYLKSKNAESARSNSLLRVMLNIRIYFA